MSSRRGGGKPLSSAATNGSSSSKGKNVAAASVEQLSHAVADVTLQSPQDDGDWEVFSRKSKNRAGSSAAAKQWAPQNSNSTTKAWGHSDSTLKVVGARNNSWTPKPAPAAVVAAPADPRRSSGAGRGYARPQSGFDNAYKAPAPQPVIRPPLEHGWNWQSRPGAQQLRTTDASEGKDNVVEDDDSDVLDDGDDDDDEDELLSDEFDSDSSEKSHGTLKKSKWFVKFFNTIDGLQINDVTDPERQWHCPACQGGPGAIDWYRGLQPLLTHAKTKGGERMKVHRKLAELLEEELRIKGTSVVPPGEAFGRWKGVKDEEKDYEIVWPPMVMIMNTRLDRDDNEKWIGMGNQELLEYFDSYHPMRARHSYGPSGHRGMSILIFEASVRGYHEAERLHKHFVEKGRDREAWHQCRHGPYDHGGKRLLHGFLALKEDLDVFNQHSQGKSRLKFDLRSHHEMVTSQIRQMSEDNQQLGYFKEKLFKKDRHAKALEESLDIVSQKLRKTMEENRIVRRRTKMQHEENKEEMYMQEQFFNEQIKIIHDSRDEKEENFERVQQEEREKVKQSKVAANASNAEEIRQRTEEISRFMESQDKDMEEYVERREALVKAHEEKINALKRSFWEQQVELEKQLNAELASLMEKYSPLHSKDSA